MGYLCQLFLEKMRVLLVDLLHATDARLVKWLQDVERRKEKGTRSASGVENRDLLQGMIKMCHEQMIVGLLQEVLRETTNVEVVGDKVVDFMDFSMAYFTQNVLATLQTLDGFSPYLSR